MKCTQIPFIDNHQISKGGDIFKVEKNKDPIKVESFWNRYKCTIIDNILYRVDELICRTYYGPIPFPIMYKDSDIENCVLDNLVYEITSVDIIDDLLFLNKIPIPFKLIKGSIGEFISQNGVLYSYHSQKIRRVNQAFDGYCAHHLRKNDKHTSYLTHRLVYETWVGDLTPNYVIDHLDGRKWNNHVSNLELVTSAVNNQRAFSTGLKELKWDKEIVHIICRMIERNYHIQDIYNILGVSEDDTQKRINVTLLVSSLISKERHRDVSCNYDFSNYDVKKNHFSKIYNDGRKEIIEKLLLQTNLSQYKIADIVGISRSTVETVKHKLRLQGLVA